MSFHQHGDFEVHGRAQLDGKYQTRIKHLPTGIEVTGESYGFYTDELEAWKQMAVKLAEYVTRPFDGKDDALVARRLITEQILKGTPHLTSDDLKAMEAKWP